MDGNTVSTLTMVLFDILIGSLALTMLLSVVIEVQVFIFDRRKEKRDKEYHDERMGKFKN